MHRTEFLNHLIRKFQYTRYLEIGHGRGHCFQGIEVAHKVSVDPGPLGSPTYRVSSDGFFEFNRETWDLVFVDGLHHKEQVRRDIENSRRVLSPGGTIVVHDCNPSHEFGTRVPQGVLVPGVPRAWWGDVWKEVVRLRQEPDLDIVVGAFDNGVGVIRVRENSDPLEPFDAWDASWEDLVANRMRWLRLRDFSFIEGWV